MSEKFVPSRNLLQLTSLLLLLSLILSACGGATAPATPGNTGDQTTNETAAAASPANTAATTAAVTPTQSTEAEPTPTNAVARSSNLGSAKQTVKFWFMPNGPAPAEKIQTEIDAFVKQNPDIAIDAENIPWGTAYTQIQTAVQGGEGPCITQLGTTWVSGFSAMGGLRSYTADEIKAVGGENAFVKAAWATTGVQGSSDVTALPWFIDARAIAYRKDIFQKAGVDPKEAFKDLDSFEAALMKIKDANLNVAPIVHPGRSDWNVWQNTSQFIWAYGGDILDNDGKKAIFNSPEAIKGAAQFASFYGKGLTPDDTMELNSATTEQRFGDGQAATMLAVSSSIANAKAPKDAGGWSSDEARSNVGFAEFPAGPGGQYTFVGGSGLGILKSCPAPEAALKWVQFLLSEESQARYSSSIGFLPALKEAQSDAAFSDPLWEAFKAASEKGKAPPAIAEWGAVENTYQTELQGLWEDVAASPGKPVDEAAVKERLDAAAETVDGLLQE